jgi:hypothetical protein
MYSLQLAKAKIIKGEKNEKIISKANSANACSFACISCVWRRGQKDK